MKIGVYAVRDEVAEVFMYPHTSINNAVAERDFRSLCSQDGSPLHANRSDLVLYRIGSFDDNLGSISPDDVTPICRFKERNDNA